MTTFRFHSASKPVCLDAQGTCCAHRCACCCCCARCACCIRSTCRGGRRACERQRRAAVLAVGVAVQREHVPGPVPTHAGRDRSAHALHDQGAGTSSSSCCGCAHCAFKLHHAVKLLDDYRHGSIAPHVTDEALWEARKIKEAILHPDTNEVVPMPFRMSGFVPFGTPIVVGKPSVSFPHPPSSRFSALSS